MALLASFDDGTPSSPGPNGRSYNRSSHLPARRNMMQRWTDYLDNLIRRADNFHFKVEQQTSN